MVLGYIAFPEAFCLLAININEFKACSSPSIDILAVYKFIGILILSLDGVTFFNSSSSVYFTFCVVLGS